MTSTAPTLDELASALSYIRSEWVLEDGWIDSEQWAEALAFARYRGEPDDYRDARECEAQLTPRQWADIAARAAHMWAYDGFAFFDQGQKRTAWCPMRKEFVR